ncbi:MAG TPA: flavin reductase family protein [Dehalococcoidia bacterium]|nr:flavin reductase family protein [Dehalococcoidia bacterium]
MTQPRAGSMLSLFWTPIVAIGASDGARPNAQISVSTFGASVVPDRPRLICVLYKANHTHDLAVSSRSFSVSVLAEEQVDLIPALGFVSGRDRDKLDGLDYTLTQRGNSVFTGCTGWLECEVIEMSNLGDSTAFLAAVLRHERLREGYGLTWSRLAPTLPPGWLETWNAKLAGDIVKYRELMHWLDEGG